MTFIEPAPNGVTLRLKVVPGASRTRLAGVLGDRLKVQVAAPPEAGKANKAVIALLAKSLGVAKQQVAITAGQSQPAKTVTVTGVTVTEASARLSV